MSSPSASGRSLPSLLLALLLACAPLGQAIAGKQQYEPMSAAVRSALAASIADRREGAEPRYASLSEKVDWLASMSGRLPRRWKPDYQQRVEFLTVLRYEAQRAGLDPNMVLGLIEVESYFRKYAVSSAGARGYMQVMPFWTNVIGDGDATRLFDMRANLRYGCTILRHYIDLEKGDLFRALGRYNGSTGRPEYPNAVLRAWKKWEYVPRIEQRAANLPAPRAVPVGQAAPLVRPVSTGEAAPAVVQPGGPPRG